MSLEDAQQDAAVLLLEMRAKWDEARVSHLRPQEQERLIAFWVRRRLIDKYSFEFRKQASVADLDPDLLPAAGDPMAALERAEAVDRAVAALAAPLREVVELCVIDGLTQQEAAKRLRVTQATVCRRLEQGLDALRDALE